MKSDRIKKLLWIVPSIIAFLIALIPTLTNQWPLTLDIFWHIRIAEVYSQYGFTLVDPLVNPPSGTAIGYPPLFAYLLVFLGSLLKINYFQVAKLIQPFMAFFTVLSISYVAKKFYGDIAGISAGFLILSSYLFSRIVSPLPETLALMFVPLVVYTYYRAVASRNYKYALLSSFLFLIVIFTHEETTLLIFTIITSITIVVGILKREKGFLINYALFLSVPLIATLILYIGGLLIDPVFANKILAIVSGYITQLPFSDPISIFKYIAYIGIALIFAIAGSYVALKRRSCKDLFILVWILVDFHSQYIVLGRDSCIYNKTSDSFAFTNNNYRRYGVKLSIFRLQENRISIEICQKYIFNCNIFDLNFTCNLNCNSYSLSKHSKLQHTTFWI